jgi:predicted O-methyltransferase YrrM
MFHHIPQPILDRMAYLQSVDSIDRLDGTSRPQRLRQIPPVTGRFLAVLAAAAPPGQLLEIGTSAGYSSLWLSLACRQRGDGLVTFEVQEGKAALAQETFRVAEVEDTVTLVHGDARIHLANYRQVTFCFLDCEKELYPEMYDRVVPNLVPGGIFAADNAISHQEYLQPFIDNALADERLDALVVPVGKGVLVCRKL